MKGLLLSGLMFFSCSIMATTEARQFIAADQSMETQVCIYSATKSMRQFSSALHQQRLNYQSTARKLFCNDEPVAVFAARYNPDERVSQRLARYSFDRVKTQVSITELASLEQVLIIAAK